MKLLTSIFLISLFAFCACKNTEDKTSPKKTKTLEENTEKDEVVEEDDNSVVSTDSQTTDTEKESVPFRVDSLPAFYNKVLKGLFPNRVLSAQYVSAPIAVSPEALEDIEGGGMPTKHLRIMDEYDTEVGAIIYELGSSSFPNTYSIGVIQKDYNLVHAQLISMDGRSVLAIFSNTGGNPDKGPYVCSYFTYLNAYMHLEPIITTTVDEITKPNLSVEEIENAIEKLESINQKSTIPKKYFENSFNNSVGE